MQKCQYSKILLGSSDKILDVDNRGNLRKLSTFSMFHMEDDDAVLGMIQGEDDPVGADPVSVQPFEYAFERLAGSTRIRQEMFLYFEKDAGRILFRQGAKIGFRRMRPRTTCL
jgi:hypothetical protein